MENKEKELLLDFIYTHSMGHSEDYIKKLMEIVEDAGTKTIHYTPASVPNKIKEIKGNRVFGKSLNGTKE